MFLLWQNGKWKAKGLVKEQKKDKVHKKRTRAL